MVPPTVKNFAWRVVVDSLPTWQNKNKRGLEVTSFCLVCATEPEDAFHALCRCPLAVQLWECMSEVWRLLKLKEVSNTCVEWLLEVLYPLGDIERAMLLFTLWRCWHNRNELVHNKIPASMVASRQYLCSYLESLIAIAQNSSCDPLKGKAVISYDPAINRPHEISRIVPPAKWLPPPAGWVKLNTDGSWTNDGRAGAGMVLRDNLGNIIYSSCMELFSCRDALEAELCACMEGLSIAIPRTELPVCIEMDSLIAVNMLKDKDIDRSIYASLVAEIKYLKSL